MYLPSVAIYMYLPFSLLLVVFNITNAGSLSINNAYQRPMLFARNLLYLPSILKFCCCISSSQGWIFVHCTCKVVIEVSRHRIGRM